MRDGRAQWHHPMKAKSKMLQSHRDLILNAQRDNATARQRDSQQELRAGTANIAEPVSRVVGGLPPPPPCTILTRLISGCSSGFHADSLQNR